MKKTKNSKVSNNVKVSDADIKKYAKRLSVFSKKKAIAAIVGGIALIGAGAGTAGYFINNSNGTGYQDGVVYVDPVRKSEANVQYTKNADGSISAVVAPITNRKIINAKITIGSKVLTEGEDYSITPDGDNLNILIFKETIAKYNGVIFILPIFEEEIGEQTFNVTFNDQFEGGASTSTVTVNKNSTVSQPKVAYHEGYGFAGWFTDAACTYEFNFDTKITSNITLYGKWVGEYNPTTDHGLLFAEVEENGNIVGYSVYADDDYTLPYNLVIPRYYKNQPVIQLAEDAFCERTDLHSVTLPSTITEIPYEAFYECYYLTRVDLADPDAITYIGNAAFDYCESLRYFEFGKNIESIGSYAFYSSLIEKVKLGSKIVDLGNGVFEDCYDLVEVDLSECDKLTYIPTEAFYWCFNLKSVTLPNNVLELYDDAFQACSNLSSITIPASVKKIDEYCFNYCTGLAQINFAENSSLVSIGYRAFQNCVSLAKIRFPKYLTDIDVEAFRQCINLKEAEFTCDEGEDFLVGYYNDDYEWTVPEGFDQYNPLEDPEKNAKLLFDKTGDLGYCFIRNGIKDTEHNVECVTCEGGVMVNGRADLSNSSVIIPLTAKNKSGEELPVKSINAGAFSSEEAVSQTYEMITDVEIEVDNDGVNSNLLEICNNAFYGQTSIAKFTNLSCCTSLYRIGSWAFYNVGRNVEIPDLISLDLSKSNVEDIGVCAFYGSYILESIKFPKSLLRIGTNAFNYATNLTTADFKLCKNLTEFGYEESSSGMRMREPGMFYGSGITGSIDLSQTQIIEIPEAAFYYCDKITEVILPSQGTLLYIGVNAFFGSTIKAVSIPSSVVEIEESAFAQCPKLQTVYIYSKTIAEQYNPGNLYTMYAKKYVLIPLALDADTSESFLELSGEYEIVEEPTETYLKYGPKS